MIGHASLFQRIETLAFRDRMTRYAGGWIGPYWAQLVPMVWIAFLVLLFEVLERTPPIHVSIPVFIATGVLPYIMFRQAITSLARTAIANRHLKNITPIDHSDLLLATGLLEGCNMLFTTALIFCTLIFFGGAQKPADIATVVFSIALIFMFSCSIGRLISTIGLFSDSWARSFPIILRPFFWISGIFYIAAELPKAVQDILWYNPLLHIIELGRTGFFSDYTSPIADPIYPIVISSILFLISRAVEGQINTSHGMRYQT